jgi:CBS domain-containing protein
MQQIAAAQEKRGTGDLRSLFFTAETWTVDPDDGPENTAEIEGGGIVGLDEQYIEELDQRPEDESAIEHSLATDVLADLNPRAPITIDGEASLSDVVAAMRSRNVGSMLVVDDAGVLVGVFTERDILDRVVCRVENLAEARLADYMTRSPVTLKADDPIAHALFLMSNYGFRHLPVVDSSGAPVGVISFRDVVNFIERHFSE